MHEYVHKVHIRNGTYMYKVDMDLHMCKPTVVVLKARPQTTAFCMGLSSMEVPEQALDGIPLGL